MILITDNSMISNFWHLNEYDYPAHAARLLKLAVDCTGLRSSKRERNNSAVISNCVQQFRMHRRIS